MYNEGYRREGLEDGDQDKELVVEREVGRIMTVQGQQ